jgi:hypothetical protein
MACGAFCKAGCAAGRGEGLFTAGAVPFADFSFVAHSAEIGLNANNKTARINPVSPNL